MPKVSRKTAEYARLRAGQRFITLDVSSSATGWAYGRVIDAADVFVLDFGVIRPPSSWDFEMKMGRVIEELSLIIPSKVDVVAMEWQSHKSTHNRVQGLAVLGQAQGAVWQFLVPQYKVLRVGERTWTKIGGRNARKDVRQAVVKERCPEYAARVAADPKFDRGMDASDAIGLAYWWFDQGVDE